jgi:hypothetical protein
MTTRQLHNHAYQEWQSSSDIKGRYHTFEYYWWERYARVYELASRSAPTGQARSPRQRTH